MHRSKISHNNEHCLHLLDLSILIIRAIAIVNKEPISLSSPLQKSAASNNNKKTSAPAQQQRRPVVDNDTRNNQPHGGQGANDSVAHKCCCACLECCAELSDSDGENIVSCLCALCEACDSD